MTSSTLKRNRARCKRCGDSLESVFKHDFQPCSCMRKDPSKGIFIDGGRDYHRCGGELELMERIV